MNQRWKVIYTDKKGREIKKGHNANFGFHINRPFYIMSRMSARRVIEVTGGRWLKLKMLVRNRNAQKFVFDQVSKTIRSWAYRGRSFDIQNSGRGRNIQVWATNSRWF